MDSHRIPALLEPFLDRPLTPLQLEQTLIYIDLLLRWNARINLTAIRNPEEIITRHFGESFFLARHVFPEASYTTEADRSKLKVRSSQLVIDLGSGAGFPGLPVKIFAPEIRLTLIESNHKKAAFLREVARALTLTDVDVIAERAEALAGRLVPPPFSREKIAGTPPTSPPPTAPAPHGHSVLAPADVVTFRAVENFERTLSLAFRFLAPNGRLAILISGGQLAHLPPSADPASQTRPDADPADPNLAHPRGWRSFNVPQSHKRLLALARPMG